MAEEAQQSADTSDGELSAYERHRAIVRETDKRFSSLYGYGGGVVLVTTAVVVAVVAWLGGGIWTALPWVLAVTVFFIALFALNLFVRRRRRELRESVEDYCRINDIDLGGLREYYAQDGIYPYFEDLFAERERA